MSAPHLRWHRRLEARVAAALAVTIAVAVGAVVAITGRQVSTQSHSRSVAELLAARAAFYRLMDSRTETALALAKLVTQLPVFRAHLTDARLASDRLTIEAMLEDYRRQLAASFAVATREDGTWLASSGWDGGPDDAPPEMRHAIKRSIGGASGGVLASRSNRLILVVTTPVQFADEVLGTLSFGYELTDALARDIGRLAQCDVLFLWGTRVVAASLPETRDAETTALAAMAASSIGVLNERYRAAGREYVAGAFTLSKDAAADTPGRLVLLADWQPTQQFVTRLQQGFLAGGATVLGIALMVAIAFSRRLSQPLREIAAAAGDIAAGNLARSLPVRGNDEAAALAQAFNDMSASLRTARDRLTHDAIHDHLTQLPNRVLFTERLDRAMARRARHPDYKFAVLYLDLDRFKHVNDSLGHAAGDALLVAFAQRLAGAVRREDLIVRVPSQPVDTIVSHTLARFGGDEFVILLDDIEQPSNAVRVAERIQQLSAEPLSVIGREVFASASIGVAVCSPSHHTGDDVVRDADIAMYRAKEAGEGTYAVFDIAMHQAAAELLQLETDLRRALERREFRVRYQPIVSLATRRTVGYEALVRWAHPQRGLLNPPAFLGVAEELGLIASIDEWVLMEACRQGAEWHRALPADERPTISVNLSAKALSSELIVQRVRGALGSSGFPPGALRLEVTESVAVSDPYRVQGVLRELRQLGARVSLDDFGTGYCSLSYLQQFPVDVLKVDRAFVARADQEGGRQIIGFIVNLAQTLGLEVVAEGTETRAQVEHLAELGCAFAQGHYFAQPLDATEIMLDSDSDDSAPHRHVEARAV